MLPFELYKCFFSPGRYLSLISLINLVVGGSFVFSPTPPVALPGSIQGFEAPGTHLYRTDFGLEILFLPLVLNYILSVSPRTI